jgi:hypothetical protein
VSDYTEHITWDACDSESCSFDTLDDAVAYALDAIRGERWPRTLKVDMLRPFFVGKIPDAHDLCIQVLDEIDEENGGEDGPGIDASDVSPALLTAAEAFIAVLCAEYVPGVREGFGSVQVNVGDWLEAHASSPKLTEIISGFESERAAFMAQGLPERDPEEYADHLASLTPEVVE